MNRLLSLYQMAESDNIVVDCFALEKREAMSLTDDEGDCCIAIDPKPDIEYGEDGIFIIDGAGYVKEKGPDCLISKNYEYPDIFPEEGSPIKCVGKVIGILNPYDIIK